MISTNAPCACAAPANKTSDPSAANHRPQNNRLDFEEAETQRILSRRVLRREAANLRKYRQEASSQEYSGTKQNSTRRKSNDRSELVSAGSSTTFVRAAASCSGGERGIRTPDRGLGPYNGLANRRLQPLGHLSGSQWIIPDRRARGGADCQRKRFSCAKRLRKPLSPPIFGSDFALTGGPARPVRRRSPTLRKNRPPTAIFSFVGR